MSKFSDKEHNYVIFQTRVGVLPSISKYRETSLKTRWSRVFFNEFRDILKSEEEHLTSVWNYFSNEPVFQAKIQPKVGKIQLYPSSDF